MLIIEQSQRVLSSALPLARQIERAGRLAYKSEDKMTQDSSGTFVAGMIKRGHWPVLDMGTVTIKIVMNALQFSSFCTILGWKEAKYIQFDVIGTTDKPGDKLCVLTGSPRALTELINRNNVYNLLKEIGSFLKHHDPVCFSGLKNMPESVPEFFDAELINPEEDQYLDNDVYLRHVHVGVHFITNRAVTHELVRHRPCGFIQESQRYCRYGDDVVFIKPTAFFEESAEKVYSNQETINDYDTWKRSCEFSEITYKKLLKKNTPQASRTVLPNSCKTEIIVFCNLKQWEHIFRLRTSKAAEPSMQEAMNPVCATMRKMFPMIDVETKAYQN
jgi:thymidylate synthase (FAD)